MNKEGNARHELDYIFRPRSIAVIGASRQPKKIGREIIRNLLEFGFQGKVFPVNPNADEVNSIKCYPTVLDIPDPVDLAIITVPREKIWDVIDDCSKKGIRGLLVITAGFKEIGEKGLEYEKRLKQKVESYGMRMVGPNCMGIINTEEGVKLNATFASDMPLAGNIGFISQSGALGAAILSLSRSINLGFSMFASIGNKTNISSNDLLSYWENDDRTKAILLYLENFGNPRKFTQIARRISQKKPILAVKAGRTLAGARAASSHTGSMANLDIAVEALLEQCGVIRASSIDELFDMALAFTTQPIPKGDRVCVLTNAGGPAIMATDALINLGLKMANLSAKTVEFLRTILPDEASLRNPVDMLAGATEKEFSLSLKAILEDENVDAVIVINVPPIMQDPITVAKAISEIAKQYDKPVLGCFMGVEDIIKELQKNKLNSIPLYTFAESPARALAGMVKYHKLTTKDRGEIKEFKVDKETVEKIIMQAKENEEKVLSQLQIEKILTSYGIPYAASFMVKSLEECIYKAREIGYPIVLKAISPHLTHKSDWGGVIVDIRGDAELIDAYQTMNKKMYEIGADKFDGILIQKLIKGGKEIVIGMSQEPTFGPLIMVGLGGIYVETIKDVAFRIHPITDVDAKEMIESLKAYPLLKGVRGEPPVDIDYLAEILLRFSLLINDFPFINEIDINPFVLTSDRRNSMAIDARIIL